MPTLLQRGLRRGRIIPLPPGAGAPSSSPARTRLPHRAGARRVARPGGLAAPRRRGGDAPRAGARPPAASDLVGTVDHEDLLKAAVERGQLADVWPHLRRPPIQPAQAGRHEERLEAPAGLDVPDGRARRLRMHPARDRRHHVRDHAVEPCLRDRRQDRQPALALPEVAAREPGTVLRRGQPRIRRLGRPALHDHARCPPRRPRPQHRRGDQGHRHHRPRPRRQGRGTRRHLQDGLQRRPSPRWWSRTR